MAEIQIETPALVVEKATALLIRRVYLSLGLNSFITSAPAPDLNFLQGEYIKDFDLSMNLENLLPCLAVRGGTTDPLESRVWRC